MCTWLILRLLYVLASVCLFVHSSALITCARLHNDVICHEYSGSSTGNMQAHYAEVRQASLVLYCLNGEKVVGSDDTSVFASFGI